MKKILGIMFALTSVLTLSGCTECATCETCENHPNNVDQIVEDLFKNNYELPEETVILLLNNDIVDIYVIDEAYFVVYQEGSDYVLVSLNDTFEINYELDGFGYIGSLEYKSDGMLYVTHYKASEVVDIIDDGNIVLSMEVSYLFIVNPIYSDGYHREKYLCLDNGYFLYTKKTEENDTDDTYQLLKTNGTEEMVLYEFESQYSHSIYQLADDTLLLTHLKSTDALDTVVHLNINGDIIHQEQVNLMGINLLSDGYLLELFGSGISYFHIRRDLQSNDVWVYQSEYLILQEEYDDYLLFDAHPNNGFDEIKIYNDGTYKTSIIEEDTMFSEYWRNYLNEDVFIYIDYRLSSESLYDVLLYTKEEELLKTLDYSYKVEAIIKENMFYLYGFDGTRTVIDTYDFDGYLIGTNYALGKFVQLTSDGFYITVTDDGFVHKTDTSGNQLWVIDSGSSTIEYIELSNNVGIILHKNYLPTSGYLSYTLGSALIVNNYGEIVTNLSEHQELYSTQIDGEYFYLHAPLDNVLYRLNSEGNIVAKINLICDTNGKYFEVTEGKLHVYETVDAIE